MVPYWLFVILQDKLLSRSLRILSNRLKILNIGLREVSEKRQILDNEVRICALRAIVGAFTVAFPLKSGVEPVNHT